MGGNIFADNIRLSIDDFQSYSKDVTRRLYEYSPRRLAVVPYYYQKESFGDLDIVIEQPKFHVDEIKQLFNTDKVHKQGTNLSFQYQCFQTDLIFVPSHEYEISYHYFSWNDLGNLIGRIFHKTGFKYGHKGLYYVLRDGNWQFDEVLVTRSIEEILPLIGLNVDQFISKVLIHFRRYISICI
jgi:hypothetical protein